MSTTHLKLLLILLDLLLETFIFLNLVLAFAVDSLEPLDSIFKALHSLLEGLLKLLVFLSDQLILRLELSLLLTEHGLDPIGPTTRRHVA